jgi:membrane fusion protein (multidrug efflux system)
MNPGMIASPGQPILTVDFLDWLYVSCNVPSEQSGSIHKGMTVQIVVDARPGETYTGTVSDVNSAADPQSRQVSVQVRVENPKHLLMPGTYARVSFPVSRVNAKIAVPREAVRTDPKLGTVVTVVDSDGLAKTVAVKTGGSDAQSIEILDGLQPGDRVVALTYSPIKDGQQVREEKGGDKKGTGR